MNRFPEETRLAIISDCRTHNETYRLNSGMFTCVLETREYIVKYGASDTLAARVQTQAFLHKARQGPNDTFRIPELIDYFDDGGRTYLIMESVTLVIASPPFDMDRRIEAALSWLWSVLPPPTHELGPLGGGCIRHGLFNEGEAPTAFKHVTALERYLEVARKRLVDRGEGRKAVTFEREKLICVQADMNDDHFGVDEQGRTVIMGFGSISFLPESFGRYTLIHTERFSDLPDQFGWLGTSNMETMVEIGANLAMTSRPSLNLNEDGLPIIAKKVRKKRT